MSNYWHQSLFNGVWSGSSTITALSNTNGIITLGNLYRWITSQVGSGAWITANGSGLGNGTSIVPPGSTYTGFTTTPTTFNFLDTSYTVSGVISFSSIYGFTGSSLRKNNVGFNTSNKLISYQVGTTYGGWISLL